MTNNIGFRAFLFGAAMTAAFAIRGVPAHADSHGVPVISGTYLLNAVQNCLPATAGDLQDIAGTMAFDPKSGKVKLVEYVTGGNPLTLEHGKGTETYSNSAKTLTLQTTTFPAFYGKPNRGVVDRFSFIGIVPGGCALHAWLSRQ